MIWIFQFVIPLLLIGIIDVTHVTALLPNQDEDHDYSDNIHTPDWMIHTNDKNHHHHKQHDVINNAMHWVEQIQSNVMTSTETPQLQNHRILQQTTTCNATADPSSEDACVLEGPQEVCVKYNNQTNGFYNCTCERFGTRDTQINCTYTTPQCNTDNTSCYIGSINQIINVAYQARVVTTCTTFIKSFRDTVPLNQELCINIFPTEYGKFQSIDSCFVSLQPINTTDEMKICSSCKVCPTDSSLINNGINTTNPNISFDCCNIITDIKQTCQPVSLLTGVAIPQYDDITKDNMGKCTSHGSTIFDSTRSITIAVTTIVALAMMYPLLI
jgi:hypothetical protein